MRLATILSLGATAYGLAFDGPQPTPVQNLLNLALDGMSPKPTNNVQQLPELFRRQQTSNGAVCGYLNGAPEYPVSCPTGSCIFSTAQKWFGCCSGTKSSDCSPVTRCINSASISSCADDASCYNDPSAMACSATDAPFCINMFAKIPDGTMTHWVCGKDATSVGVLASTTASGSVSSRPAKTTDASAIKQDAPTAGATGAAGSIVASARSTGAAAMYTAQAALGVAGGLAGAFAVFL